jgi:hypothetical protein
VKLKPFLDSYFGPFKDKHRYWVGLLLLVRGVLFISFAATPTSHTEVDLLVTVAVVLGLLMYLSYVGRVYKKNYLSLLENSYLVNLGMLAAGTLYVSLSGGSQSALAYTSVGIAFSQFVTIAAAHAIISLNVFCKHRLGALSDQPQAADRTDYERVTDEPVRIRQGARELVMTYDGFREPVLKYLDAQT